MKTRVLAALCTSALLFGSQVFAADANVLATVGKLTVTQEDFDRSLASLPPQVQAQVGQSADQKAMLLDEIVKQRLVYVEAEKNGYAKNKEVTERLDSIKKDLMVAAFVDQYLEKNVKVGDKDLQAFYKENEAQFVQPETVSASHILLKDEAKAKEVLALAVKAGADFAELAKKYSEGPSGPKGGELGNFGRGQMVPEFEQAAFAGKTGVLPELVKTKFGYHIIKVNEKTAARTLAFDEVKDRIAQVVENRMKGEALDKLVKELELKHAVKRYKENLK